MTTPVEQITAQIAQLDTSCPSCGRKFSQLDAQAVALQLAALGGDADAAQQLQASQRARGLAKIQIDDLTAGRKHLEQQLAEAQDAAAKAEAAECLPRLAGLPACRRCLSNSKPGSQPLLLQAALCPLSKTKHPVRSIPRAVCLALVVTI